MKTTYKIVRYDNGWAADMDCGDSMKNRSGVFEDPEDLEEDEDPKLESLLNLIVNLFKEFDDVDLFYAPTEEGEEDE